MAGYDSYKDSGVYYLPIIPKDWNILRGKYLFKQEKRDVNPNDEIITCFRDGQVTLRKNRRLEGFTNSKKEIGYQGVKKGDLVIHNMDAFAGAIGVSDSDGKSTPVYSVCTPKSKEINQYYYCYFLRWLANRGFIQSLAKGIRERSTDFRFGDFKELLLPIPPIETQNAIVDYIKNETSKIDTAIAQQQKMIDLLNERKQIIINNAVTKGLDPNAKMKDSGVEWIGEVPEGWEVKKLKFLVSCNDESLSENERKDLKINYIEIGDVDSVDGVRNYTEYAYKDAPSRARRITRKGDVIVSTVRTYLRAIAPVEEEGFVVSTGFAVLRAKNMIDKDFLAFSLMSDCFVCKVISESVGTSYPAINATDLLDIKIALPSLEVQKQIVVELKNKTLIINKIIDFYNHQIQLLQERKQILINEVVTGKVKVC